MPSSKSIHLALAGTHKHDTYSKSLKHLGLKLKAMLAQAINESLTKGSWSHEATAKLLGWDIVLQEGESCISEHDASNCSAISKSFDQFLKEYSRLYSPPL